MITSKDIYLAFLIKVDAAEIAEAIKYRIDNSIARKVTRQDLFKSALQHFNDNDSSLLLQHKIYKADFVKYLSNALNISETIDYKVLYDKNAVYKVIYTNFDTAIKEFRPNLEVIHKLTNRYFIAKTNSITTHNNHYGIYEFVNYLDVPIHCCNCCMFNRELHNTERLQYFVNSVGDTCVKDNRRLLRKYSKLVAALEKYKQENTDQWNIMRLHWSLNL